MTTWADSVLDADAASVAQLLATESNPFLALAEMRLAGVVLRQAFPAVVRKFATLWAQHSLATLWTPSKLDIE
eukprot:SAG31_NODE_1722_length_7452_cov_2.771658_12_plen_73_part_00